jgi:hypothetical protein
MSGPPPGNRQDVESRRTEGLNRIFREQRPVIDDALKQGVREAMICHKRDGLPVVIYRNGKTVHVKPEDLGY